MTSKSPQLYNIKYEGGKYYYKESEGSEWNYVPDDMLFASLCNEIVKMDMGYLRDLADRLDRSDVPLNTLLSKVLSSTSFDGNVDTMGEWGAVGSGLYTVLSSSVSRWRSLFRSAEKEDVEKYLAKYAVKEFNKSFAKWGLANDVFHKGAFVTEVFRFVRGEMEYRIENMIDKMEEFRDDDVNWLRFLEFVRDELVSIDSKVESFVKDYVSNHYQEAYDRWRGVD